MPQEKTPFTRDGIIVMPHEKYMPGLLDLYNLNNRMGKATPESTQVDLEGGPDDKLNSSDRPWGIFCTSHKTWSTFNMVYGTRANLWHNQVQEQERGNPWSRRMP